ncbi:MAG: GIY-YIG nuclease family protein [Patescibacteria group bacterium]
MYYTYVLLGKRNGKFYIGFTNSLKKRLEEHKKGKVKSTKDRGKFVLVYYEACADKKDAIKREKYFKTGFGRRFLNNRLEGFLSGSTARALHK